MPTWDKILEEVDKLNPLTYLKNCLDELYRITGRTTISYMSAFSVIKPPVPSPFHAIIDQDIQGFMTCVQGTDKSSDFIEIPGEGFDFDAEIVPKYYQAALQKTGGNAEKAAQLLGIKSHTFRARLRKSEIEL